MSAQETVCGQKISSNLFAESITANPPTDWFAGSLLSVPFPCISIEASQPCQDEQNHQLHDNSGFKTLADNEESRCNLDKAVVEEQAKELPRECRIRIRS